ncbi:Hypothetical predicted protein [Olea europaea subsp. europaea]|uniref:Uncharacterized protein n=1 Tax=Olea europaea subsp. europaea TaxID=158383 RepID=A0A8S0RDG6_OLEEU|nr:Hypothetical predicted protein [Olea europaea subsp. europaea]
MIYFKIVNIRKTCANKILFFFPTKNLTGKIYFCYSSSSLLGAGQRVFDKRASFNSYCNKDEMLVKKYEYLVERAKEQQLPEDTPLEEIPVDDSKKLGRQILRLGDGCLRDIGISSSNIRSLEKELEAKRAAHEVANAARVNMEQKMQNKLKVVEQQFNPT